MTKQGPSAHDLVVIGASAGGVEALRRLVANLPADFPASICVVLHIAPSSPSALPKILERAGKLPCRSAADGDNLEPGQILVAPPDHHLEVQDGHVRLTRGPRENGHRPAVDVLFRSAAAAGGGRVIGVVLSGTRDDGSVGLAVIKENGGAAVVQDPQEAMYAGMPLSAIASAEVDAVVPSEDLARTLVGMLNEAHGRGEDLAGHDLSLRSGPLAGPDPEHGQHLTTICPECGGVLTEGTEAGITQWECRVGHRYSSDSMFEAQAQDVEAALWAAVRALEDRRMLLDRMADRFRDRNHGHAAHVMHRRAEEAREQSEAVRDALKQAAAGSLRELVEDDPRPGSDVAPEPSAEAS